MMDRKYCIPFLLFVLIHPTYSKQCDKRKFDWVRKDDINLDDARYPREWIVFNCILEDNETNVSLWHKNERVSDQTKVKQFKNQMFNVTNLNKNDQGEYSCKACSRKDKVLGYLDVYRSNRGKAYQTPKINPTVLGNASSVSYGSKVTLECITGVYYALYWFKNNATRTFSNKRTLYFKSFTQKDDGVYTCRVGRPKVNWEADTSIFLKADEVEPTLNKENNLPIKTDRLELQYKLQCEIEKANPTAIFIWHKCIHAFYNCSNKRNETIGWYRSDRKGTTSKGGKMSTLNITREKFQNVSYRCTATNTHGQDNLVRMVFNEHGIKSMKARISDKKPKFETAGDNITMVCECNGSLSMEWIKEGHKLSSIDTSDKQNGSVIVTKKRLEILNFSKTDEGVYECHVNYSKYEWRYSENINITMKVKPKIRADPHNSEPISYKNGMTLKCKLLNEPVPKANITWTRCICDRDRDCSCAANEWLELPRNGTTTETNKLESTLTIQEQTSDNVQYRCMAKSVAGTDKFLWRVGKGRASMLKDNKTYLTVILYITSILTLVILMIIAVVLYKRKKLYGGFYIFKIPPVLDYIERLDEKKTLMEQSNKLPYISDWEYPRKRVHIERNLGHGAFGQVFLAQVVGISAFYPRKLLQEKSEQRRFSVFIHRKRNSYLYCTTTSNVAVKMLNENCNESDISDLLTELKILIHIGQHKNIVNILGACTKGPKMNVWIIMEYCPYGNLSEFLKDRRIIYEKEWSEFTEDHNHTLSISDLAAVALQVASGMEFLISRKCIHCDLAARNVLIGEDFIPKIADFGLSRNMYKDDQYVKRHPGFLPIKWLSIEALGDRIFSEKSDVWSFGILLWEIFALGGSPYPGLHSTEVYEFLCKGNRMDSPAHCPSEIYELMLVSWDADPCNRPDFKTVRQTLTKILKDKNRQWLFQLELDDTEASSEYQTTML